MASIGKVDVFHKGSSRVCLSWLQSFKVVGSIAVILMFVCCGSVCFVYIWFVSPSLASLYNRLEAEEWRCITITRPLAHLQSISTDTGLFTQSSQPFTGCQLWFLFACFISFISFWLKILWQLWVIVLMFSMVCSFLANAVIRSTLYIILSFVLWSSLRTNWC